MLDVLVFDFEKVVSALLHELERSLELFDGYHLSHMKNKLVIKCLKLCHRLFSYFSTVIYLTRPYVTFNVYD